MNSRRFDGIVSSLLKLAWLIFVVAIVLVAGAAVVRAIGFR